MPVRPFWAWFNEQADKLLAKAQDAEWEEVYLAVVEIEAQVNDIREASDRSGDAAALLAWERLRETLRKNGAVRGE